MSYIRITVTDPGRTVTLEGEGHLVVDRRTEGAGGLFASSRNVTSYTRERDVVQLEGTYTVRTEYTVPREPGTRFIAHSPQWCDGAEDQWEFIAAGPRIVCTDSGAVFEREAFESEWTVTSIVDGDDS